MDYNPEDNVIKWISVVPAVLLAGTHVILHAVELNIKNKEGWHWLSIFSGISAAYVFLGLIPDIDKYKYALNDTTSIDDGFFDKKFYALLILFGFTLFYSIESLVKHHRKSKTIAEDDNPYTPSLPVFELLPCAEMYIFVIHIISFSLYGAAISFLLPKKYVYYGPNNMWFYYAAMQAHYIIDDMTLHDHFGRRYDKYGRIPLIIGTIAGFIIGILIVTPLSVIAAVASVIAGGTIFNILKTELPVDTKASVPLFLVGLIFYTVLIVFLY